MRVFKRSILLFCTLILTFSIISTSIQTKSMLFGSGKADDLVSYYGISNQVTKKYQDKDKNITNIKVTLDTIEHQVKVPVLSQSHLNYAYNMAYDLYNKPDDSNYADNSCSVVASTCIIKYYETEKYNQKMDATSLFIKLYRDITLKGWTSATNGTIGTKHDNIVNHGFKNIVGSKNVAENKWYDTKERIENNLKKGNPLMFTLPDHAVVATGLLKAHVTYTTKETTGILWWKKTTTVTKSHIEEYIEVMNGWGYHSYINASMISNVFNGNITTPIKIND